MPDFSFQSESLTPQSAASATLGMTLGADGASLFVRRPDRKLLALKSWQFKGSEVAASTELRQLFGGEPMFNWTFAERCCTLSTPEFTLVPRRLFEPDDLPPYLQLLLSDEKPRYFGYAPLDAFDCVLVWAADKELMGLLTPYFQPGQLAHLAAPLIKGMAALAPEEGYGVFANLRKNRVQIGVFERRNLLFFNTFQYLKPSDLLYYVLLAYKQFDLDPLSVALTLSGQIQEDSEIFRLLLRYVRPMRFPPLAGGMELPASATELPAHYWFDLSTI